MEQPTPKYTAHQVARGARADAETHNAYYLFKGTSLLRATYQIRLLTYRAWTDQKRLIINVFKNCKVDESLRELMKTYPKLIRIERVSEP
jgi:hypothetical protein